MTRQVNDAKPKQVVEKTRKAADRFKSPVIACMGPACKPDIDDLRERPSLEIVDDLCDANVGRIVVVEPHVREIPRGLGSKPNAAFCDAATAVEEADIVLCWSGTRRSGRSTGTCAIRKS